MQTTLTKRFNEKRIEACRLELTKSVILQAGDISQISEGFFAMYFSFERMSGGGSFESFVPVNQNNSIVMTFEDWRGKVKFDLCFVTLFNRLVVYFL